MSLYPIFICALSSCLTIAPSSPAELTFKFPGQDHPHCTDQLGHQQPTGNGLSRATRPTWNPIPSGSTQSAPKTKLSTNNQLEHQQPNVHHQPTWAPTTNLSINNQTFTNNQIKHQRPTRAVTTNWAESSEVTCAPPLMVGPLQRNALHAHCTLYHPPSVTNKITFALPFFDAPCWKVLKKEHLLLN